VARRVWAPEGQRPAAPVWRRYEWLYVYGFVRPRTGRTWWGLLPEVSLEAMGLALAAFARDEGVGPAKRAVLALDNAGRHTGPKLDLPAGVHLAFLPAYSPELQPAERLWGRSTSRSPAGPSPPWTTSPTPSPPAVGTSSGNRERSSRAAATTGGRASDAPGTRSDHPQVV
jgi:hypothetical protein